MSSNPGERGTVRSRQRKVPGNPSQATHGDDAASPAVPEPHLTKPSWRWRLLLCTAVVCAVVGLTAAVVPELFLSAAQVTVPHLHP